MDLKMVAEVVVAVVGVGLLVLQNFHTAAVKMVGKEPVKMMAAAVMLELPGEWSERNNDCVVISSDALDLHGGYKNKVIHNNILACLQHVWVREKYNQQYANIFQKAESLWS